MTAVLVVIPCRDEAASVASVVEGFRRALPGARVLVVDNASRDGTGERASQAGAEVLAVPRGGKGAAVRAALTQARQEEVVLLVDGDGAFDPREAPKLLEPLARGVADMVVGSRFSPSRGPRGIRRWANWVLNALVRALFGGTQGDLLSGYRALSPEFWSALRLETSGFEIEMELGIAALTGGYGLGEVPVTVRPRAGGTSKIRMVRDGGLLLRYLLWRWWGVRKARSAKPGPIYPTQIH